MLNRAPESPLTSEDESCEESYLSRRAAFLRFGTVFGAAALSNPQLAAAWQHAHAASAGTAPKLSTLSPVDARDIEALCEQILPVDDTPGAKDAGVIYFIDHVLGGVYASQLPAYRKGLAETRKIQKQRFANAASIADLSNADATDLVRAIEKTEFFELVRTHTIMGFLGDPSYGGNRGEAGWKAIGFEDKHVFTSPFGYYDDPAKFPEEK